MLRQPISCGVRGWHICACVCVCMYVRMYVRMHTMHTCVLTHISIFARDRSTHVHTLITTILWTRSQMTVDITRLNTINLHTLQSFKYCVPCKPGHYVDNVTEYFNERLLSSWKRSSVIFYVRTFQSIGETCYIQLP